MGAAARVRDHRSGWGLCMDHHAWVSPQHGRCGRLAGGARGGHAPPLFTTHGTSVLGLTLFRGAGRGRPDLRVQPKTLNVDLEYFILTGQIFNQVSSPAARPPRMLRKKAVVAPKIRQTSGISPRSPGVCARSSDISKKADPKSGPTRDTGTHSMFSGLR